MALLRSLAWFVAGFMLDTLVQAYMGSSTDSIIRMVAFVGSMYVVYVALKYWLVLRRSQVEASSQQILMYQLELWFSASPYAKPVALLILTFLLIFVGGVALVVVEPSSSLSQAWWHSWTWIADPGTHADVDAGPGRWVALGLTIGGMLVFALLIGLVSDEISSAVDDLKKGNTDVLETNHVVILNWSDKAVPLIEELAIANESLGGAPVVVMSKLDKLEVEHRIEQSDLELCGSRVVVRSGDPSLTSDLAKLSLTSAKAVVILAEPDMSPDDADALTVRITLSVNQLLDEASPTPHIVAEINDVDNVNMIHLVGQARVEPVVSHDIIGRLMISATRQPAIARTMGEIISFRGVEMYVKEWPELVGKTFGTVHFMFDDAIPVGIRQAGSGSRKSRIVLNPSDATRLAPGDGLIVFAEDDDSYLPKTSLVLPTIDDMPLYFAPEQRPEKVLFINWRRDIWDMIRELDKQVGKGSVLYLLCDKSKEDQSMELRRNGLDPERLENLRLVARQANTASRRDLEKLRLEDFDSILVFEDTGAVTGCRSLATLLLVRDIQKQRGKIGGTQTQIVSEVLDTQTQRLVAAVNQGDYVMSNHVVSAILAQVAECRDMNEIFSELLQEEGHELHFRPVRKYVEEGRPASFADIMARARRYKEVAVGFKSATSEEAVVNPSNKFQSRTWDVKDLILVLAES